ncbi:MAG: hypothetical protein M9913_03945 [Bryobacteraceae bacterium]|nr:hypothetical protein [Solibacteraceae bacterium]MCO5350053.1 hypothetical protein [Bryobacteraceae bacterium]
MWKLIDAAGELGGPCGALVRQDAHTDLRRNEILALHINGIDWIARVIIVQEAILKQVAEDTEWEWV